MFRHYICVTGRSVHDKNGKMAAILAAILDFIHLLVLRVYTTIYVREAASGKSLSQL